MIERIRVLLAAVPTWGAAATSVLTVAATHVVPLLPGDVAVRVGAWVAVALGWVAAVVGVVSRVTPVPARDRGLLPLRRLGSRP